NSSMQRESEGIFPTSMFCMMFVRSGLIEVGFCHVRLLAKVCNSAILNFNGIRQISPTARIGEAETATRSGRVAAESRIANFCRPRKLTAMRGQFNKWAEL